VTDALLRDGTILAIAKEQSRTAAQVILRWHLQTGITPIPKASSLVHLAENVDCFGFELSDDHMRRINALNRDQFALFDADVLA
jgi:2,5-diketo-D-gluconate reductase A